MSTRVLTFWLGDEVFALDVGRVREIVPAGTPSTVPLMPAFVRGVVNLRGAVLPVIDLAARLGRAPGAPGRKSCIVVFDAGRGGDKADLGLLVDAVSEVVVVDDDALASPPDFGAPVAHEFIHALVHLRQRFVVVLDPARAFDIDAMAELCAAA